MLTISNGLNLYLSACIYDRRGPSKGQNRKCTAEPSRDVKSVRDVKFANNYLNM